MSFGFGVGDFLAVYDKARAIVDACREGPSELRELIREVETLQSVFRLVKENADNPRSSLCRKGEARADDLKQIMENCKVVLDEVQAFVDKHSSIEGLANPQQPSGVVRRVWHSYQVGTEGLDNMRGKLTYYTSTIDLFLNSLQNASLPRIESMVYELYRKQTIDPQESTASIASISSMHSLVDNESDENAWSFLRGELLAAGISDNDIEDHKMQIISYIKGLITDALSASEIVGESNRGDISKRREIISNLDLL